MLLAMRLHRLRWQSLCPPRGFTIHDRLASAHSRLPGLPWPQPSAPRSLSRAKIASPDMVEPPSADDEEQAASGGSADLYAEEEEEEAFATADTDLEPGLYVVATPIGNLEVRCSGLPAAAQPCKRTRCRAAPWHEPVPAPRSAPRSARATGSTRGMHTRCASPSSARPPKQRPTQTPPLTFCRI
jgi:hypothetical protein